MITEEKPFVDKEEEAKASEPKCVDLVLSVNGSCSQDLTRDKTGEFT